MSGFRCPRCGHYMRIVRYFVETPASRGWHERHECTWVKCWHTEYVPAEAQR